MLPDGAIGWPCLLPRWREQWPETALVLHQIRAPLPTIGSLTMHTDHLYQTVETVVGALPANKVQRAAEYWVRYNRICGGLAERSYRVEDLAGDRQFLASLLHDMGRPETTEPAWWPPTDTNKRPHKTVMWQDLAPWPETAERVRELARQYGYDDGR